ncbi:MAG: helix-turn-helix domain-containing protein [Sphingomonas sp.]
MTAELHSFSQPLQGQPRFLFVDGLEPLELLDPTEAARMLNLARHTLACYRNLGNGPTYYKFGRWVRYAGSDLRSWSGLAELQQNDLAAPEQDGDSPTVMVDTAAAARYLTISRFCLRNYRIEGGGPRYHRLGRRVHYAAENLRRWAIAQRVEPTRNR